MKLSIATLALFAAGASAHKLSPQAARKVLRTARRMDEAEGDDAAEDENAYLANYSLKFISCDADYKTYNDEGEVTYGSVIVRACPADAGCKGDYGCKKGYGDYLVNLEDFVDAYFDDQADNMGWDDDNFDINKFAKCEEYEVEKDGDDDGNAVQYFIGPTCTSNGKDIKLDFFSDDTCTTVSSTSFSDVSNGWTLPYSDGGLISTSCMDCVEYNEDEAAYELRDVCNELMGYDAEDPKTVCETNMAYFSYYGKNEYGCEAISDLLPRGAKPGSAGAVFGWIIFVLSIVGAAGYVMWWRKKKMASGMADGMLA